MVTHAFAATITKDIAEFDICSSSVTDIEVGAFCNHEDLSPALPRMLTHILLTHAC